MDSIKIFKSVDELSLYFAQKLAECIRKTPANSFFSMALSGGSSPQLIFEYLASHYIDHINWQKVLVFWGDERCVEPESNESNFRMAKESLLDFIPISTINVFRIIGESNPYIEADRYAEVIRRLVPSQNSIPRFDFMMLGLGDDGHTASIFPGNTHLFNSDKLFEVAQNPYSKQKRITATGKIINQSRFIVFIVTGESKAEMVARIIEKKDGYENLPASMVHPEYGELLWLLDDKAAMKLHF